MVEQAVGKMVEQVVGKVVVLMKDLKSSEDNSKQRVARNGRVLKFVLVIWAIKKY